MRHTAHLIKEPAILTALIYSLWKLSKRPWQRIEETGLQPRWLESGVEEVSLDVSDSCGSKF